MKASAQPLYTFNQALEGGAVLSADGGYIFEHLIFAPYWIQTAPWIGDLVAADAVLIVFAVDQSIVQKAVGRIVPDDHSFILIKMIVKLHKYFFVGVVPEVVDLAALTAAADKSLDILLSDTSAGGEIQPCKIVIASGVGLNYCLILGYIQPLFGVHQHSGTGGAAAGNGINAAGELVEDLCV